MTPETLKSTCIMFRTELEHQGASLGIMSVFDSMCSYLGGESRDLNRALAALEEAEQQQEKMKISLEAEKSRGDKWEKAFDNADRQYLKQERALRDLRWELAEAQAEIERLSLVRGDERIDI